MQLFLVRSSALPYISSQNAEDDYEYETNVVHSSDRRQEVEAMTAPEFVSVAQKLEVNLGDTVRLPCLVDRLEKLPLTNY